MATNTSFAYTAYFPIFRDRIASLVNVSSMRDGSTRPVPFRCLWDTGASISLVSPRVADTLRLDVLDESITIRTGLGARSKVDIRMAYLHVVLGAIPLPLKVGVVDMPSSDTDIDVVLGLDLISQGSFAISYDGGQLLFSFCYPPRRSRWISPRCSRCSASPRQPMYAQPPTMPTRRSPPTPRPTRSAPGSTRCSPAEKFRADFFYFGVA